MRALHGVRNGVEYSQVCVGLVRGLGPELGPGCVGPVRPASSGGPGGQGATGGAAIAGRDKGELAATLIAFRSNERPGTIMGRIARGYSDAEIAAIAEFIARQR